MSGDRSRASKALIALAILLGALSLVAAMTGSPAASPDEPTIANYSGPDLQSLFAALVLVMGAVGFVVLILILIFSRDGDGEQRQRKQPIGGVLLMVFAVWAALRWLPRNDELAPPEEDDFKPTRWLDGIAPETIAVEDAPTLPLGPFAVGMIVLVLLVAAGVITLLAHRPDGRAQVEGLPVDRRSAIRDMNLTIDDLLAEPEPRRAVLMAYQRLEAAFENNEIARQSSTTPGEFLAASLHHLSVSTAELSRLTELFDRAMFSPSAIDATMQRDAIRALTAVRDDLANGDDRSRAGT